MTSALLAVALTLTTQTTCGILFLPVNADSAVVLCRDHKMRVFSLPEGKLVRTIDGTSARLALSTYSDDGRWVMTSDYRGDVAVVDTTTGTTQFAQHVNHYLTAAAFSHDGRLLAMAAGDEPVRVIDLAARGVMAEFERNPYTGAIAFSRDNQRVATADGDGVRIFEVDGKLISHNRDFLLEPLTVDFSSDGKRVLAGGADKRVVVIDSDTGKMVGRVSLPAAVMWSGVSPDGKRIAIATMNADNMELPSPVIFADLNPTGKQSQWMPPKDVIGGGWTRDGHFIAAIATEGAVRLQPVR